MASLDEDTAAGIGVICDKREKELVGMLIKAIRRLNGDVKTPALIDFLLRNYKLTKEDAGRAIMVGVETHQATFSKAKSVWSLKEDIINYYGYAEHRIQHPKKKKVVEVEHTVSKKVVKTQRTTQPRTTAMARSAQAVKQQEYDPLEDMIVFKKVLREHRGNTMFMLFLRCMLRAKKLTEKRITNVLMDAKQEGLITVERNKVTWEPFGNNTNIPDTYSISRPPGV